MWCAVVYTQTKVFQPTLTDLWQCLRAYAHFVDDNAREGDKEKKVKDSDHQAAQAAQSTQVRVSTGDTVRDLLR